MEAPVGFKLENSSGFTRDWFDAASKAWRKNKRQVGSSGAFVYTCDHTYKSGKRCGRDTPDGAALCRQHGALAAIGKLEGWGSSEH